MSEEKKQEFWRWTESNWRNPDIKWEEAKFITAGIDVGSVSSQACIMADGEIFAYGSMRTGSDSPNSARNALNFALEATDMPEDSMDYCIGTGYGRVNVPMADRSITEIACHARGANFIYGPAGGQRTCYTVNTLFVTGDQVGIGRQSITNVSMDSLDGDRNVGGNDS